MARLIGVFNTAHSPFCYTPAELWNEIRASRSHREDVPVEDSETARTKAARIKNAFLALKQKLLEKDPDVVVVIGDDQGECFNFNNFPGIAVYVGDQFEGSLASPRSVGREPGTGRSSAPRASVANHPGLATSILVGLVKRKFDPAFCMEMPNPERGVGHAIMRPYESITDMKRPIVPILLNCYYAPQITGERAYELGKAVREIVNDFPGDLKVAVVGSGGLWHTPGVKNAYLDEEFDQTILNLMQAGDAHGMAEHFDNYQVPEGDASQALLPRGRGSTGMPGLGGPQGGTRETCNWIAAAAVADGSRATLVDYVPVYASPIGAGFAYWDNP